MSARDLRSRKSSIALAIAGAIASLAFEGNAVAQTQNAEKATDNAPKLEEIVVTAQRRAEPAQSVPISITAMNTQRLQDLNIVSTQSLGSLVSSMSVTGRGQGSREVESPTIRGQGATYNASPGVINITRLVANSIKPVVPVSNIKYSSFF